LLGLIICVAAAYLLAATPLATLAVVVAAANALVAVTATVSERRRGVEAPRALTALGHVTTALGGFFLFVWFKLPSGG
jgi:hypothetical protein